MQKIDLHIHSNLSDGDDSVHELVSKIKDEKIELFSITDHDNVRSIDILSKIDGITYIPGVEMSSVLKKIKMHILGYGITSTGKVKEICDDIKRVRRELTLEILEDLRKRGYYFPIEKMVRFNEDKEVVLSKVDISKLLMEMNYAKSVPEAFYGILSQYKIGHKIRKNAEDIIEAIKNDGGLSILAHPGEISKNQKNDINGVIDELIEIGIDGIEVFTPKNSSIEEHNFLKMALDKEILITGGSDYHGSITKPNITLCDRVRGNLISEKVKQKSIKH